MMTKQEIFDKVAKHLLTQGTPAKDAEKNCAYRGQNGTKCAVGCLIPDELYDPDMEGHNVHWVLEKWPALRDLFTNEQPIGTFLASLQKCHDAYMPEDWKARLREIARQFNLSSEVLDS